MIVALRITTGGLGCRAYVDGYCGRATLMLSDVAAGGVAAGAAGAGACAARVPPADAHAPVSASSRYTHDRMLVASGIPGYLTSSTTNGCPTNSVLRRRRSASVPTYMVNGTRDPVTSMRNPGNVPAGTVTASGALTLNVSTLMTFSLGVKKVIANVLPGASGRAGTTNGTAFSSTVPGGSTVSMSKRFTEPSGCAAALEPFTRPAAYVR